jgi:hypothetical protein
MGKQKGYKGYLNVLLIADTTEDILSLREILLEEAHHYVLHWYRPDELDLRQFCAGHFPVVIAMMNQITLMALNSVRIISGVECRTAVIWIGSEDQLSRENERPTENQDIFIPKASVTKEKLASSIEVILSRNLGSVAE